MHAQLEPLQTRFIVDFDDATSRADPQERASLPFDCVDGAHVEHNATLNRNALSVVAGPAAADGQWRAKPSGGPGDADHVRLIARRHYEICDETLKLPLENGAEPEEVARLDGDRLRVGCGGHVAQRRDEAFQVIATSGSFDIVVHV